MKSNKEGNNQKINDLKHSLRLMEDVLDNAYQGIALVDKDGYIVKWGYEKLFNIKEKDVLGKHVEEVIENTRLHIVAKTGKKELCQVQRIQGRNMIASRIPVIKNGEIVGAVGTVLFSDVKEVKDLAKRLKALESTVDKYKEEINTLYRAKYSFDNITAVNKDMVSLKNVARRTALSDSTVLIRGESGTGKEYFAHAIHNESKRKYAPFIRVNCASLPNELIESELFGYEGGAFTGAKKEGKIGKLELAQGGTLLLDEIGAMPYPMQAKLLRVLEEREFERIGGNTPIIMDVRLIASTNEDLQKAISEGNFRRDLYYRLNVVELDILPLRRRKEDVPILCESILGELCQSMGFRCHSLTEEAEACILAYSWPGNVRELRNVLERAANIASGEKIVIEELPSYITDNIAKKEKDFPLTPLKEAVASVEKAMIIEALKRAQGNRTEASKYLGIHRTGLYKKMEALGMDFE